MEAGDAAVDVGQYLSRYHHPTLHVARVLHLISRQDASVHCPVEAVRASVAAALKLVVEQTTNVGLYREFVASRFERGFDVAMDAEVVKQMEAAGSAALHRAQEDVATCQHEAESALPASPQAGLREKLAAAQIRLARAYAARGDSVRAHKVLTQARQDASLYEAVLQRVLCATVAVCFQTSHHHLGATIPLPAMESIVANASAKQGPPGSPSRVSDEFYVCYVVTTALAELQRGNYREVARQVLTKLNRYPPAAAAAGGAAAQPSSPQLAATYSAASNRYLMNLAKHIQDTELTNQQDLIAIAVLCLFASHTRSESVALLSQGVVKGWLEEDPLLDRFTNHMLDCSYEAALQDFDAIRGQRLWYELHASPHVSKWYIRIRETALVEYAFPFRTVSVSSVAQSFGLSNAEAEGELKRLIRCGRLPFRLDSVGGLLVEKKNNRVDDSIRAIVAAGNRAARNVLMGARALSMLRHGVILRATLEQQQQQQQQQMKAQTGGLAASAGAYGAGRT